MATSSETRTYRIRIFAGIIAIVLGAWFLAPLFQALLIIFAGALLGVFLTELTKNIAHAANLRYRLAYCLVILALLTILAGTAYYMGSRVANQITILFEQLSQASSAVESRLNMQDWWRRFAESGQDKVGWAAEKAVSTAKSAVWITLSVIGGAVMVVFLGFYFALQPERYREGAAALFQSNEQRRARHVLDQLGVQLWRWFLGRLMGMLVIGAGTFIGLWVIGIPLPVTLAVLAAVMNFVPNVGPIVAGIPAVLFGLQQGTDIALFVFAFYFVLQFFESYFLTPLIDQHQVSLPPGLTLSCQLLLGVLAGFLGLFLATPLLVVVSTVVRELRMNGPKEQ